MTMLLTFLMFVSNPVIDRVGDSCPTGYYISGGYCVPSGHQTQAFPEAGLDRCPMNWEKRGKYCIRTQ